MRMLKGIDDFFYVLVIALALIVIFSVVSVLLPFSPGGGGGGASTSVAEFTLGTVGYAADQPRSSSLGSFTVGETQTDELKKIPQLEISAGWFGVQSETLAVELPSYYRDSMRDILLSFNVYATNQYGNLNIKWNGKNFYNEKPARGPVVVQIDSNYIDDSNSLEIWADGPGLAFWAANVYTLRDFKILLEYGPSKLIAFTLSQGELDAFSRGELSFIGFGSSNLRAKINGYKVWDRVPNGVETITFNFTSAPLVVGNNIIALDTPSASVSLNNAMLKLFMLTNQVTRTRNFDLTENQFSLLDKQGYTGTITYDVNSITRNGDINIKLNGNSLSADVPRSGLNTVSFTSADAQAGTNTLEFSGTGYWDIGTVQVVLSK